MAFNLEQLQTEITSRPMSSFQVLTVMICFVLFFYNGIDVECGGSVITASLATAIAPWGSEIIIIGLSENLATFQPLKIVTEDIRIPSIIFDHPADFKRIIQLMESNIIQPGKNKLTKDKIKRKNYGNSKYS